MYVSAGTDVVGRALVGAPACQERGGTVGFERGQADGIGSERGVVDGQRERTVGHQRNRVGGIVVADRREINRTGGSSADQVL